LPNVCILNIVLKGKPWFDIDDTRSSTSNMSFIILLLYIRQEVCRVNISTVSSRRSEATSASPANRNWQRRRSDCRTSSTPVEGVSEDRKSGFRPCRIEFHTAGEAAQTRLQVNLILCPQTEIQDLVELVPRIHPKFGHWTSAPCSKSDPHFRFRRRLSERQSLKLVPMKANKEDFKLRNLP